MLIVYSQNGVSVRLTAERWQHIMHRHPEMVEQRERVLETLAEPELIQAGDYVASTSSLYRDATDHQIFGRGVP